MIVTNKNNRPRALVAAVEAVFNKEYVPGADHYVTQLVQPPQMVALREKHDAERTIDVDDAMHIIRGLAVAHVLETAGKTLPPGVGLYEKRFETEIEVDGKRLKVSMRLDALEQGKLTDYKDTSVYAVTKGGKDDWRRQLEAMYVILSDNGVPVDSLSICALLKDFRPMEAKRNPEMPQKPIHEIDFGIPLYQEAKQWMVDRIRAIRQAREALAKGEKLPECSAEEMWAEPEVFAVKKKGGVKAIKRCSTMIEAEAIVAAQKKPEDYEIEHRPYVPKRCIGFCDVSQWCAQFAAYKAKAGTMPVVEEDAA